MGVQAGGPGKVMVGGMERRDGFKSSGEVTAPSPCSAVLVFVCLFLMGILGSIDN